MHDSFRLREVRHTLSPTISVRARMAYGNELVAAAETICKRRRPGRWPRRDSPDG